MGAFFLSFHTSYNANVALMSFRYFSFWKLLSCQEVESTEVKSFNLVCLVSQKNFYFMHVSKVKVVLTLSDVHLYTYIC